MATSNYLENINLRYKPGNATEHSFLRDLQQLIEAKDIDKLKFNNDEKED